MPFLGTAFLLDLGVRSETIAPDEETNVRQTSNSLIGLLFAFSFSFAACDHQSLQQQSTRYAIAEPSPLANYVIYNDVAALESAAELIVVGRPQASLEDSQPTSIPESEKAKKKPILNESVMVKDAQGAIVDQYTITAIKVQKVFQGKVTETEIKIVQPAAAIQQPNQPAYILATEDYTPMQKNAKYLLFLKEVDTVTYPNLTGVYTILSASQGKFNFDKTDSAEADMEAKNAQYRELKEKVKKKYAKAVNAIP